MREPPDPLPNSEVKPLSADGSVGSPHARVGHRQALIMQKTQPLAGFFVLCGRQPRGLPMENPGSPAQSSSGTYYEKSPRAYALGDFFCVEGKE